MFGMSKRRTGLPGIMTGYGGGTFDVDGTEVIPQIDPNEIRYTPEAQRAMDNAPRLQEGQKPKSFWEGGDKFTLRDGIAGALAAVGDGFSNWANGGGGQGVEMLAGGRINALKVAREARAKAEEAALKEQARQLERQEVLQDYGAKKQIDQQYREPPAPDAFERTLQALNIDPASPQGQDLLTRRLESMARDPNDEFVVVPIQGRGTYAGPRSGLPGVFGQGQSRTVVPQSDWDNAKPMGGAGGNASGSF